MARDTKEIVEEKVKWYEKINFSAFFFSFFFLLINADAIFSLRELAYVFFFYCNLNLKNERAD
mgnify:CR=1 FL=1